MFYRGILGLMLTAFVLLGRVSGEEIPAPETKPDTKAETNKAETKEEIKPITTVNPGIPIDQLVIMVKPLTKAELQVEADAWFGLLREKAREIAAARLGVKKLNEVIKADKKGVSQEKIQKAKDALEEIEVLSKDTEKLKEAEKKLSEAENANPEDSSSTETVVGDKPKSEGQKPEGEQSQPETKSLADVKSQGGATDVATSAKSEMLADMTLLQDARTALSDRLGVVLKSLEEKGGEVKEYRQYMVAVAGVELDTSDAGSAFAGIVGWILSKEGGQRWGWNFSKFFLILFVTWLSTKVIAGTINWLLDRRLHLSQLAESLIASTISRVLMLLGFAVSLTALEVDITPILATIGATGLVVGLALQGTLSNFASGLMILINRPFDVGNVVTAGGVTGTVYKMNLVSTTFRTFDNQTIHVPNNAVWNNVITNITANSTRRVDLEFGIGYDDDFEQAEKIIRQIVSEHDLILELPEPVVVTHALGDSAVKIVCRPWTKTENFWTVTTDITREVKRQFDKAGISIPYPQQDIHVYTTNQEADDSK